MPVGESLDLARGITVGTKWLVPFPEGANVSDLVSAVVLAHIAIAHLERARGVVGGLGGRACGAGTAGGDRRRGAGRGGLGAGHDGIGGGPLCWLLANDGCTIVWRSLQLLNE